MSNSLILQQSLEKLFNKGNSVLFRWRNDSSWNVEFVSNNVLKLFGYTPEEFLQKKITFTECIHKDYLTQVQNEVLINLKNGEEFFEHKPYKIITKEKKERWILDQTVLEKDENGEVTHFIGYLNDITQTVELSNENHLLQERLNLVAKSSHDGIWDWDIKTGGAFFSTEYKKMLGYSDSDLEDTGEVFFSLIHPDDQKRTSKALEKHFKDINTPFSISIRLLCKDGSYKWILSRGKVILDSNNKPERMLGSHIDISHQKDIEAKLNRLNNRFTNMFKNHDAIMLLIEPKSGKVIDANLSAQRFYGYTLEEFVSLKISDVNTSSTQEIDKLRHLVLEGVKNSFVFEHKTKNGELVLVESHSSVIETDQGEILFSIIYDVTREKENEEKLSKVLAQLQQAQKIAKLGIWELNLRTKELEWSDEVFKIFETDENFQPTYTNVMQLVHPEDIEALNDAYVGSLIDKQAYEIEHRIVTADGRIKYVLEKCDTEFDEDSNPIISRGTVQDISELTMLDQKVRAEGRRFKALMDNASDGILIINEEWKLVDYSKMSQKMLGYSDEEMQKLVITDWDIHLNQESLTKLIKNFSINPTTFETVHKRKDGTIYNASITAVVTEIEGEKFIYASVRDISELKKLQDAILYEKNFIESIIESSNAIVAVIDSDGRMIKLNKYGQDFSGYTQDEIAEEPYKWKTLLPLPEQSIVGSIVANAKLGNIVKSYQNSWVSKSGEERKFEWSNTLVKKEDGSMDYIATIGLDITEQEEQKTFLNMLINSQSHMIALADGKELKYVNQVVLEFYNVSTLETLKQEYNCLCESFIENDLYFHLGKIPKDAKWIEEIVKLPLDKQIVSIFSVKENKEKIFKVNIEHYDTSNNYILTLVDVSDTVKKQLASEYKSYHDPLTKIYNREFFYENWASTVSSHKLNKLQTGVAMIDIDHFKTVNDTYGHDVGDTVLKQLVDTMKRHSRESDVLIRWGGEEFLLILPVRNQENLYKILESIRERVMY